MKRPLRWRPGGYLRNSGHLLAWMGVRALAQAATVLALTRLLGAAGYGSFVTILAVASFFVPFAGMGLAGVLLRDLARNPDNPAELIARALKVWQVSLPLCILPAIALAGWSLPAGVPLLAIPAVMTAEVASASLTELVARTEQAQHRISRFGAVNAGLPLLRLMLLGVYALLAPTVTLEGWLWVYAAASMLYMAMLWLRYRTPTANGKLRTCMSIRDGIPFAVAATATRLQAEFNKPVLAHQGFALAGNYGAAQRACDLASLPLLALQEALWPRLYASKESDRLYRIASIALLTSALCLGTALWLLAPLLPLVLGNDFVPASGALRWLAWLPVLQCLRGLCNFRTIAAYRTHLIGQSYVAGATTSILLTLWLVPEMGVRGAVLTAYFSEMAVIGTQILGLFLKGKSQ